MRFALNFFTETCSTGLGFCTGLPEAAKTLNSRPVLRCHDYASSGVKNMQQYVDPGQFMLDVVLFMRAAYKACYMSVNVPERIGPFFSASFRTWHLVLSDMASSLTWLGTPGHPCSAGHARQRQGERPNSYAAWSAWLSEGR